MEWQNYPQRFGLAYTGHNVNQILGQLDKVNEWIDRLWSAQESELKEILNDYYTQKPIKNAGRAFPSLILYIRDPDKFNNCFHRMIKGLKSLTNFSNDGYSGDFYFEYNDKVNQLKEEYGLIPEELDILLCIRRKANIKILIHIWNVRSAKKLLNCFKDYIINQTENFIINIGKISKITWNIRLRNYLKMLRKDFHL